ncbi:helix-turn-helix domain-containing protein [Streptomyces sp. ISL-100]|uniref:winged helix-turn-helix domain-containing protein n=1 Tax=Streptomyces sp. ISL-100 TaxID=2819173 RepID=UPI0035ABD567
MQVDGERITLPHLEFDLLAHLVQHPGRVYSREHLIRLLWPTQPASRRTVDVHISRLRGRLGPAWRSSITTIVGAGYKYDPNFRAPHKSSVPPPYTTERL